VVLKRSVGVFGLYVLIGIVLSYSSQFLVRSSQFRLARPEFTVNFSAGP